MGVTEVCIFGSRVRGFPLEDSDLDVVIVSEEFADGGFIDNVEELSTLWDGSFTLEMFPHTPDRLREFRRRKSVAHEAVSMGIRIEL